MDVESKLAVANRALSFFAPETSLSRANGRVVVTWKNYRGEVISRHWQCRKGQDFYPVWSHKWGHGGTCCTALSQLVRWVRGLPVLPMSSWRYWTSPTVALGRERGAELVATLEQGGYPIHVDCVLCGKQIVGGLDWWHLDNVSGPCCGWTTGCRQKGEAS